MNSTRFSHEAALISIVIKCVELNADDENYHKKIN